MGRPLQTIRDVASALRNGFLVARGVHGIDEVALAESIEEAVAEIERETLTVQAGLRKTIEAQRKLLENADAVGLKLAREVDRLEEALAQTRKAGA